MARGGPSEEHEVSLKTGANVLKHLGDEHQRRDIFIDRAGSWHMDGWPTKPERALAHLDLVFNALHGPYGEDGKLQRFLESHGTRYTGAEPYAASLAMNKILAKIKVRVILTSFML